MSRMQPLTFAHLVTATHKIIAEEDDERSHMVYDGLAEDMARAAENVYNACLRGQAYAESQS
jgi:hypothetical protein